MLAGVRTALVVVGLGLASMACGSLDDPELLGTNVGATGGGGSPPGPCTTVPFGAAQPFQVVLSGDLNASGSDIGGRAAIGGNMNVSGYGVGLQLSPDPTRRDLIVGGNLSFHSGAVPNGATVYGGSLNTSSSYFLAGPTQVPNAFPFASVFTDLNALSSYLGSLPPNGTTSVQYFGSTAAIKLTGTDANLNIFSVNAVDLAAAHSLEISAPAGSTIVVNVSGTSISMGNFAIFFSGGADREHTLFNFPNATSVTFNGISIEGSVLAPKAAVNFSNGQLVGQLFAKSFKGSGQPIHAPFKGCLPLPSGTCPPGQTKCGHQCVDTHTDPNHCGGCGNVCGPGKTCQGGHCVTSCQPGQTLCNGECVNVQTDPDNCGACGNECAYGKVCVGGQCTFHCSPGQTKCGNQCVDTHTDPNHCGGCGITCGAGKICQGGSCVPQCPSGKTYCNGHCVDTHTDPNHCGGCGITCGAGKVCQGGSCVPQCPSGKTYCNGHCVDTHTDPNHCGGCGITCGSGKICQGGYCVPQCPSGTTYCNGHCVDTHTDPNHCGGCGITCGAGKTCQGGYCVSICPPQCAPGKTYCNSNCVDLSSNVNHCGGCGITCGYGQICLSGNCAPAACLP